MEPNKITKVNDEFMYEGVFPAKMFYRGRDINEFTKKELIKIILEMSQMLDSTRNIHKEEFKSMAGF